MELTKLLWKHRFLLLLLISAAAVYLMFVKITKLETERDNLETSIGTYATQNADLRLNSEQIKTELKKSINKTLDSLLKAERATPRQVKNVYITNTTIVNNDTTYLTDTTKLNRPNLVKTNFSDDRNCIKIEGFVLSTDSFPSVAITSQHAKVETYDVTIKRKSWLFFWQPRERTKTFTKCGDLEVVKIKNTDHE